MVVVTVNPMNIQNANIIPLFSIPLLMYEVEIEEKERLFLLNQYPDNVKVNMGNLMSKDHNILKRPEVKELNKTLISLVNEAFTLIHTPGLGCGLYITQSWLNFTVKEQYHHRHSHTNSFYSAVLYLKATEEDNITFYHPTYPNTYEIYPKQYGPYNCSSWDIPVKNNLLLIFPSTLSHSVTPLKHDNLRVSLSFNTFIRGELGDPTNLNHLVL